MFSYSYAKINLALNVTNKSKPNTFHDLDMINFCVSLKDKVSIKFIEDNADKIEIICNNKDVPTNSSNLVYKVVEKFKKINKLSFSCIIKIDKKIPMQAGLAGGSSNAASTLKILDHKFKTKMSALQKMKFIEDLTSDGPYMVLSTSCRVKGKGEKIYPFKSNFKGRILLVKPFKGCNTKEIFNSLDYKNLKHPNINKVEQALKDSDLKLLSSHCDNSLTNAAIKNNEEILDVINRLKTCGFEIVSMSGSGSTVFAISKHSLPFKRAKEIIDSKKYELVGVYKIL